jgi:hypothetical protein
MSRLFMVFDVESIGLHGEGFAVGFVVVDGAGKELAHGRYACPIQDAAGDLAGRRWVSENVPAMPATHDRPEAVREAFWADWLAWKAKGATLAADCAWPVEARFLIHCEQQGEDDRTWQGPYPLVDVASVRLAVGLDPLATVERLPSELPTHDPLADARQSARLLLEAIRKGGA